MLKVGIVGMPNVGKSTLFNALLKKQVAEAANYPFCTIEPNVGVIEVPDERLNTLAEVIKSEAKQSHLPPIVPAAIQFYDIAGLVKGASEGEGLGNKFLSHIKETSLILQVVRFFDDDLITHVENSVNPVRDIQIIETELMLADLSVLDKQKAPKGNATKADHAVWETVQKAITVLNAGRPLLASGLSDDEKEHLKAYNLITLKPVLYVFNLSESQLENLDETEKKVEKVLNDLGYNINTKYILLCVKLEQDIVSLNELDQMEYLGQYGLEESGLNRLIKKAYDYLGLISFLTAGVKEVRAWTIPQGTKAPQAAAVIHTDFEKHFIKAEVVPFSDFVSEGGWIQSRENGRSMIGGKDYVMKDGDVVEFKVGV